MLPLAARLAARRAAAMVDVDAEDDDPPPARKRAAARKASASSKRIKVVEESDDEELGEEENHATNSKRRQPSGGRGKAAASAPTAAGPTAATVASSSSAAASSSSSSSSSSAAVSSSSAPASSAAAIVPSARVEPSKGVVAAYMRAREASVKARAFPLSQVASSTVATGRTIKAIPGWSGHWPPIREFMQNVIDHLELRKQDGLHPALSRHVFADADGATRIVFCCADEPVCVIVASQDRLSIGQTHTFPLHTRALDTGVDDTSKGGEATAGGFGDGFKTGIVGLLALPGGQCRDVTWEMRGGGRQVSWRFVGAPRAAVGTFAKSTVLEVHVTNHESRDGFAPDICASDARTAAGSRLRIAENVLVQRYDVRNIGRAFLQEALPRLSIFWRLDRSSVLSTRRGDLLAEAARQPSCLDVAGSPGPEPGVYIRGIWVRKPFIEGALMAFFGKLNVSGRDRNDVDHDEAAEATLHLMHDTEQPDRLAALLASLRSPAASRPSWLTKSPRFLNRLLEADPAFFVHEVFGLPKGTLFVSQRTTQSKDPFVKWASAFLTARGAPVLPLEPKAHKALFTEVSEEELEAACVKELLKADTKPAAEAASAMVAALTASFAKLLKFLSGHSGGGGGGGAPKVHFSAEVACAFVHGGHAFVPIEPLTRALVLRVLGVVQRKMGVYDEKFTHLQQGLFEAIHGAADRPLELSDIDAAISRALQVKEEEKAFLGGRAAAAAAAAATAPPPPQAAASANKKRKELASAAAPLVLDDDDDDNDGGGGGDGGRGGEASGSGASGGGPSSSSKSERSELDAQIAGALRRRATTSDVIPASAFSKDTAEPEACLKNDALRKVVVAAECGGGEIYCDSASIGALCPGGSLPPPKQAALKLARERMATARAVVSRALPRLSRLLDETVFEGYDASADGMRYLGFCTQQTIVLNLCPLLGRVRRSDTTHELVLTLCHELAHLLERSGGHGSEWRATQDRLVQAVLATTATGWTAAGLPKCTGCGRC